MTEADNMIAVYVSFESERALKPKGDYDIHSAGTNTCPLYTVSERALKPKGDYDRAYIATKYSSVRLSERALKPKGDYDPM